LKLVIIFGAQAVGKMTVGQELERITDLKLFHNHMTIELVSPYFSLGSPAGKRLVNLFRQEIFEEVSKSDLPGLIFTYVWAFDLQGDWEYIQRICHLFESRGGTVYFVELVAELEERLKRNTSSNRLTHKPTKRNMEWSEQDLLKTSEKYRLQSNPGEITKNEYIRIDNTNLSAEDTAKLIQQRFQL